MSREQTQNKIYFNANISLRQHSTGQKNSQQPRPGKPCSGTSDTQRVPSGATAGAGPAAEGYGQRRSLLPGLYAGQPRRHQPRRHSPLYRMIWSTFLRRYHRNHLRLCSAGISQGFDRGRRLRPRRRWPHALVSACVWRSKVSQRSSSAPPTCWGRVLFRRRAQVNSENQFSPFVAKTVQHWYLGYSFFYETRCSFRDI